MKKVIKIAIRRYVNSNPIGKFFVGIKNKCNDKIYYLKRKKWIPDIQRIMTSGEGNCSVISYNCFAGRIIQDLNMQYNTPTVGLYFLYPDYIEFLKHLDFYLKKAKLEFVENSKYQEYDERRRNWKHWYPIGLLGGKVEIHFLHYYTEQEAAEKWYRRAKRVNFNNLFIVGMEQNSCPVQCIRDFDCLPYDRKIFFSTKKLPDIKSNCFIKEFKERGKVGDPWREANIFYKYLIERFQDK